MLSHERCVDRSQEIGTDSDFENISEGSEIESFLSDFGGRFLSDEDDFRGGDKVANEAGGLDSIEAGEADVEKNQIRLELRRFLNGVEAIRDLGDDMKAGIFRKNGSNQVAEWLKIFY